MCPRQFLPVQCSHHRCRSGHRSSYRSGGRRVSNRHRDRAGRGGIAPIDKQSCRPIETAIAFVFSRNLGSDEHVCKVTTHEIGHTLSLEHEYLCEDPMTYLRGCGVKTFQDQEASCGTYSPERSLSRGRQNTVRALPMTWSVHRMENRYRLRKTISHHRTSCSQTPTTDLLCGTLGARYPCADHGRHASWPG